MSQKTVFISYRRDDAGMLLAQLLEHKLTQLGYDVFLDVASMESGKWDEQILTHIPRRAHFLLLLTPGALDRCSDPADWVRREYETAVQHRRNVVPIAWNGLDIGTTRQAADPAMQGLFAYQIAEVHHKTLAGDLLKLTTNYLAPHQALRRAELPAIPIDISRIDKYAPIHLLGREAELAQLDAAWNRAVNAENPRPRILTFVALGGEGKTSLVAKWAASLAADGWPGCDAAFAWSFYSQGSKDQSAASGDLFLRQALRFFGDTAMAESPAGAHEKGQRLAHLIGEKRALLILDGLEPLQFAPTSPTPGVLKDQGLAALLTR